MSDFLPNFASAWTAAPTVDVGVFAAAFHLGAVKRLAQHAASSESAARLYAEHVAPTLDRLPPSNACWLPELGAMLSRMSNGQPEVAVMQSLMAGHIVGIPGSWSAVLPQPADFSVEGHVFTLEGPVAVDCTGHLIVIRTGGAAEGRQLAFVRTPVGWRLDQEGSTDATGVRVPAFLNVEGFESTYVQGWLDPTAQGVRDPVVEWPPERLPDTFADLPLETAAAFKDVFAVLDESGPYLSWIRPLFRGAAVSPPVVAGRSYSSSHVRHAGVFSCVFPHGVEELGEVVVHEMSHQYFLMLNAIFPFTMIGDDRLYYSSLKGSARTLDRVLLAYHAAANMTVYWQDRIRIAGWTEKRADCLKTMGDHSRDLAAQLETSTGLTETGVQLFRLQDEVLAERRHAA